MTSATQFRAEDIAGLAPVMSEPRRPRVLVVATEWFPTHGGISVFNRWFCGWLAAGDFDVYCYIPRASADAREDARSWHPSLKLVEPKLSYLQYLKDYAQLLLEPDLSAEFVPDIVIGHDRTTGLHARHIQQNWFGSRPRLVQVIHMDPQSSERHKLRPEEGERKRDAQLAAIETASVLLTVGPRLQAYAEEKLCSRGPLMKMIVPDRSILHDAPGMQHLGGRTGMSSHTINFAGRIEDVRQKGIDILAEVWRSWDATKYPRARLEIRGMPAADSEERTKLLQLFPPERPPIPGLIDATGSLRRKDLDGATVAVMPSRSEGFGLAGLEAVYCETPVLVGAESGLADLIELACQSSSCVVRNYTAEAWKSAIESALGDRDGHFARARDLRARLEEYLSSRRYNELALDALRRLSGATLAQ